MANENQKLSLWAQLSASYADAIGAIQESVVAVDGGRQTSSGVVWRPGVVVTTLHGLRHRDGIKIIHSGEPFGASLVGGDAATDLAVLKLADQKLVPVETADDAEVHTGDVVLAVGRSGLGDISASAGIIARTGSAWRTWRGGQIDRLIRPDVRLYVGQAGSALVNGQHRVVGINTPALARQAVITIPARTVNRIVDAILERGHAPRPYLGVAMQPVPVPEAARSAFPSEVEQALLVTHIEPGGPAAAGGVMVGDLIVSANGEPVRSIREILHRLSASRIGDSISLVVIRGGAQVDLAVSIADRG